MPKPTKFLIHYSHKETLGHTTRVIAICKALAKRYPKTSSLHILQGGAPQDYIRFPDSINVINVPHPFDTRASFAGIRTLRHTAERAAFTLRATQGIMPDIFITEFFPFGRLNYMPELLPTLEYLAKKNIPIYASVGYPHLLNLISIQDPAFKNMLQALFQRYTKILIHTPPELENRYFEKTHTIPALKKAYREFFHSINSKILYTGYVLPSDTFKATTPIPPATTAHEHTVIVSRGGGAVYPKVIINAIQAQAILGNRYRFIIACGPATSAEEQKLFLLFQKKYTAGNILLLNHIAQLNTFLKTCAVSVSLGGYNTSVQLMQAGTRAIIIPHQHKNSKEPSTDQLARSSLMKANFQSTRIYYADLTPGRLARAIEKKCQSPRPAPAPKEWFCGATTSANILMNGTKHQPMLRQHHVPA